MSRRSRWPEALTAALARALLVLYPPSFRRSMGANLVYDLRRKAARRWRERGVLHFALWWLRILGSLLANVAATWIDVVDPLDGGSTSEGPDGSRKKLASTRAGAAWLVRRVRLSVRGLLRVPTFSAVVVLTLALGIGGTTAMFTVLETVLLEPLPYPEADRLVRLYQYDEDNPSTDLPVTGPHFLHYRARAESFSALATLYTLEETGATLQVDEEPERVRRLTVSADYFQVLGRAPLRGRTFRREEETGSRTAVVSRRLWARLGGVAGPPELGSEIRLDGESYTVVGVMPADLEDPVVGSVDVWVPQDLQGGGAQYPGNHFLSVIGRLAPGMTLTQARQEMVGLDRALADIYPDVADDGAFRVVGLHEDRVGDVRTTLFLLLGATGLVLLIACVNVANLQVVRALGRTRDVALRLALGAGRARVAGEALLESLILATAGGVVGLALARLGLRALLPLASEAIPRASEVTLDGSVLLVAAGLTLATALLFGLLPALRLGRVSPAPTLRSGSTGDTSGGRSVRGRAGLVSLQVALALMLLVGTSVLGLSAYRLSEVDLGIETDHVLAFELDLPAARYDTTARAAFHRELTDRLARIPRVGGAASVTWGPLVGRGYVWGTRPLTGPRAGEEEARVGADQRVVEGGYFEVLGIPLLEGRVFRSTDGPDAPNVVVVSESVARSLFPGASAVGQTIRTNGVDNRIIGVVGDVAVDAEGRRTPHVYHSHAQYSSRVWPMTYLVTTDRGPSALMPTVRREVAELDGGLVPYDVRTLSDQLREGRAERRLALLLMAAFGSLALTLAAVGLYGVLAYLVDERRREIGVRIALGAGVEDVLRLVLVHALRILAVGLSLGVLGSLAAGRVMASLLYETRPVEPLVLVGACLVMAVTAGVAVVVPALRGCRISPQAELAA